jgi:hypothetical protein
LALNRRTGPGGFGRTHDHAGRIEFAGRRGQLTIQGAVAEVAILLAGAVRVLTTRADVGAGQTLSAVAFFTGRAGVAVITQGGGGCL